MRPLFVVGCCLLLNFCAVTFPLGKDGKFGTLTVTYLPPVVMEKEIFSQKDK